MARIMSTLETPERERRGGKTQSLSLVHTRGPILIGKAPAEGGSSSEPRLGEVGADTRRGEEGAESREEEGVEKVSEVEESSKRLTLCSSKLIKLNLASTSSCLTNISLQRNIETREERTKEGNQREERANLSPRWLECLRMPPSGRYVPIRRGKGLRGLTLRESRSGLTEGEVEHTLWEDRGQCNIRARAVAGRMICSNS